MPHVEVLSSVIVKENQADTKPTAEVEVAFKETQADDYIGPIRVTLKKGDSRTISGDHLPANLRILAFKRLSGSTWRLCLRKSASETTDLIVERFLVAEVANVEHIKITALDADVELQIELVGIKQA